jgi:ferredoxin-nitrate reductase
MISTKNKTYKTTCCYCGVGCGILVTDNANGKITVEGDPDHPTNRGMLCSKGLNLHYTAWDKTDRLLYPEMRWNKNMPRQRVSWDTALERTARVFKTFMGKYGPESVGIYGSGQMLTEEYYVANKLMKGFIGSNNMDTNSRLCMSSAVVGYKLSLGEDSVPVCYDDIELSDCMLVAGANPAWCHPIVWRRVEKHKEENPSIKIIVVDPRKTDSARTADLHLQIKPATDITLFNAIARLLIENTWIDYDFIKNHTEGYEKLKAIAFEKTVQEAAEICGISPDDIFKAASWIGNAKAFLTMWTMGLNQSVVGVDKNLSLINLNLITGQIGKPGAGPFSLTGQPNAMGGREVGGLSNLLPAHRNLLDATHRKEVEDFWGAIKPISPKVGFHATEMFEALADGRMKAIWIIATNPLVSLPDVRVAEAALKNAKFVVVQDMSNRPETLQYADVILPAATWTEKEGTMTNSERRVSYLHKISNPPAEALPDAEILTRFAHKMGFEKQFDYLTVAADLSAGHGSVSAISADKSAATGVLCEKIFAEHVALTKGTNVDLSHINYTILKEKGSMQWGNERLFTDKKFYTPSEKAQINGCNDNNLSEKTTPQYPLILTTGRIRDQWHTMSRTGKVNKLNQHISQPSLEIHPTDAAQRGIQDAQLVEISNQRGIVHARAKISEDIREGVVFLPMHWGKINGIDTARVNNITNNLIDPRSKEPDLKYAAVEVGKVVLPKKKIVIIGAGAAGFGFIQTYRQYNETDEIHVFSREIHPFYNRVMLPDYVSGTQTWEQLQKTGEKELVAQKVVLYKGVGVKKIDPLSKTIVDDKGETHDYDVLILGTGSRAFMPKDVPTHLKGIMNMRTRHHADELLQVIKNQSLTHFSAPSIPIPNTSSTSNFVIPRNEESGLKTATFEHPDSSFLGMTKLGVDSAVSSSVVIVGGGLLGLEMAASLREIGAKVTIVQRISRFMDRQLDPLASNLLHEHIVERGIEVFYNDQVQTFYGKEHVEGIRLMSGRKIDCDAVIYAIGTIPNVEIIREAGIDCNRGVKVNDFLETNTEGVYALGEIAEWQGQMWGITAAAEEQAAVAARYLAGDILQPYKGSLSMNILKMEGLNLCSLGRVEVPKDDTSFEEIVFIDKAKRYYKKCIIQNDKLVGAILMGDKSEFLEFKNLIQNGIELSEKRLQLLRSGKSAEPVIGKLVCSCNSVGQGNLEAKIKSGCTDFTVLCVETGAGMGCGSCRTEVKSILNKACELVFV